MGTELEQVLRDRGVQTLVIAGVQTHVCIESSLRDGSARGYYIVVPRDCVGSYDRALHEATLRCVEMHFGEVPDSDTLLGLWSPCSRAHAAPQRPDRPDTGTTGR